MPDLYYFKMFESEHFKKRAGLLTFTPNDSEWLAYAQKGSFLFIMYALCKKNMFRLDNMAIICYT